MRGNSPWWFREQEEETGILTEVFDGWCGDGGSGTRRHEGVEQRAAQGVVMSDSVRGAFILGHGKGAEAVAVGARPAAIDSAVSGGVEGRGRRAGGGRWVGRRRFGRWRAAASAAWREEEKGWWGRVGRARLAGRFQKRNKKKKIEKIGRAARGFWAKIWSGRLSKINIVFDFLIQGNGIQIKTFKYFQTKFELDSK
jgi:hypothetical protein